MEWIHTNLLIRNGSIRRRECTGECTWKSRLSPLTFVSDRDVHYHNYVFSTESQNHARYMDPICTVPCSQAVLEETGFFAWICPMLRSDPSPGAHFARTARKLPHRL